MVITVYAVPDSFISETFSIIFSMISGDSSLSIFVSPDSIFFFSNSASS